MGTVSPYVNDVMLVAAATAANDGPLGGNASLTIYTAPQPATPVFGVSGIVLAQILLPDPAVVGPNNNQLLLMTAGLTTSVIADGRAAWARLRSKAGTTIMDLTIGSTGSGADVELEVIDLSTTDIINLSNIPLVLRC